MKPRMNLNKLLSSDFTMLEVTKSIEVAVGYHQSGSLDLAENLYRSILQNEPENTFVLHSLGLLAYQRQQYDQALELTSKAIEIDPDNPKFHNTIGVIYKSLNKPEQAVRSYHRATTLKPDYAQAYNNLAVALEACGKSMQAIESCKKALELRPDYAEAYYTMGYLLQMQEQFEQATECYEKAVELNPDYIEAHNHLGVVLSEQGLYEQAGHCFRRALELAPDYAEIHNNLGIVFQASGQLVQAIKYYQQALKLEPDFPEAYYNLAKAQEDQELYDEAISNCNRAIALNPDYAEAYNLLGIALNEKKRSTEAIEKFRYAIELNPTEAEFYNNLGMALKNEIRFEEAFAHYRRALEMEPDFMQAYYNLANLLRDIGSCDQAIINYKRAISLKPDYAEAHWNLSLALLLKGEYTQGFKAYKWRRNADLKTITKFHLTGKPRWDGSDLKGKTLFVHYEQGLGDNLQFIRYLPMIKQRGATIVFETLPLLLGLFTNLPFIDRLVAYSRDRKAPVEFDCYTSLMDLPHIFGTTIDNVPAQVPYIYADPAKAEYWKQKLAGPQLKVGIVWAGSPEHGNDHNRSCKFEQFLPLAEIEGVKLYSRQKGAAAQQLEVSAARTAVTDITAQFEDFTDTAAAVKNLDLVISVDTSVLHLAGAMAKPTWALLPFAPEWRWMLNRQDSPWYPTMQLFRQTKWGDWNSLFDCVAKQLKALVNTKRHISSRGVFL